MSQTGAAHIAVRPAREVDAPALAAIYNHYIRETIVTLEETPIEAAEMARRMADVRSAALPWIVAEEAGRVVGYAYASKWRTRIGYRFTAEITVYLAPDCGGRGIGTRLYGALLPALEALGIHSIVGGIGQPNEASVALHEKFGLRRVAFFPEVGFKFGRWVDVGFWHRVL